MIGEARLSRSAATAIRTSIRLSGGNEVCFVATVGEDGTIETARAVARGDVRSVLAMPGVAESGEMLLHNHPSGSMEPSDADMHIAAAFHLNGVGFGIIDNDATLVYVVTEIPKQNVIAPLDAGDVDDVLGPRGQIAAAMQEFSGAVIYEDRPGQRKMAGAVTKAFNDGGVALIEAGTGIGKSLGYLIPALRWAAKNKQRTIVSTNTITLQEQLVRKDLPFLQLALSDQPVRFALLKGWRNYLCLNRMEQAMKGGASLFDAGSAGELASIAAWSQKTSDGSLADLPTPPRGEIWDEVAAEPDLCGRLRCAHYDNCSLFKARREAAQADVVVVNHHLLLSDVAVRRSSQNWDDSAVLPAYRRLIVDEGHHLEDAAASHLGASVTRRALMRLFGRLERRGKGLLPVLAAKLAESDDLLSVASLDLVEQRLTSTSNVARAEAQVLFDLLAATLENEQSAVMRLNDDFERHPAWKNGIARSLENLVGEITMLSDGLTLVRERLESDKKKSEEYSSIINELRGVVRRLQNAGDALMNSLRTPANGVPVVRWMETVGRPGPDRNIALHCVPLDLAPVLRADLFDRVDTAVVTSATLATERGFEFLQHRLGLDVNSEESVTAVFPSPFDYLSQTLLVIPTDIPAPNENASAHISAVAEQLRDLISASDGGLFALFTSHRDVRQMAELLRSSQHHTKWPLLVHGEDTRDVLLRRFRESGRAVLLGTATFWEGVDVPGDSLRGLLIAKLPFRVPTEPMVAAQCEAISARGGNAFGEFMLPHASLRLKQGFGRLIRTATDRGVVVLSDPRVLTKRYGVELLKALPPARRVSGRWSHCRAEIVRFYGAGQTTLNR